MPVKPPVPVIAHVVPPVLQVGVHRMVPEGIPLAPDDVAVTTPAELVTTEVVYFALLGIVGCMVDREVPVMVPRVPLFSLQ